MSDDDTFPLDPPSPRARRLLWIGGAVLAVLLLIGLWLASRPPHEQLQGEVDAEEVNVATKALARVESIVVNEGDRVRKGQVLATLSAPEIDNGQQQAQAALESARALQSLAVQGPRPEDVASLYAGWQAAQASAALAAMTSRRADRLYAEGVIAAQRRDEANAFRDSSARIAEAARAQYQKARAGVRPQMKEVADAQVRAASANVTAAKSLLAETQLVSPIDGEVSRKLVEEGEIVSPVLPAIQVINIADPEVTLNVREDEYKGFHIGKQMTGHVPALDETMRFRVTTISPQGSFATWRATRQSSGYDMRAFAIKLKPVARVEGLRPGMSVLFDWPQ